MSEEKSAENAELNPQKQEPDKQEQDKQEQGKKAAERSARDGRVMSGLARIGLIVGILLLVLTVLIGMIPWLSYSLILQDDLIRRLLFCISVGLILASLGDYAFYSVSRVFTIGGAGAIALILFFAIGAQPVEPVWSARVRFDKGFDVKTVFLLTSDSAEYEAKVDPQYTQAKMYRFRIPQSIAERITQECFTIAVAADKDQRDNFKIQGADARLPQAAAYIFDFVYDSSKKSILRPTRQGLIQELPQCGAAVIQDPAPTQKQIQSAPPAAVPDKPNTAARNGWTFYGKRGDSGTTWDQRVYDNKSRAKDAEPRKYDNAEVISDVFLRPDPRKCRSEDDCDKLSPDVGIVRIGNQVKILDVVPVLGKNFWVQVETQ